MKFLLTYLRNLALIALVGGGMFVAAKTLFPDTLTIYALVAKYYRGLNLWPIIVLYLLIIALPRKSR